MLRAQRMPYWLASGEGMLARGFSFFVLSLFFPFPLLFVGKFGRRRLLRTW